MQNTTRESKSPIPNGSRDTFENCYIEMKVAIDLAAESFACWEIVSHDQARNWKDTPWRNIPHFQTYLGRTSLLTLIIQLYKPQCDRRSAKGYISGYPAGQIPSRSRRIDITCEFTPNFPAALSQKGSRSENGSVGNVEDMLVLN